MRQTTTITFDNSLILELENAVSMRISFLQNEQYKAQYGNGSEYGNAMSITKRIEELKLFEKQLDI